MRDLLPLTPETFAPFGSVLAARPDGFRVGNQGRARAWDHLAALTSTRLHARPNLGVFRTLPWPEPTLNVRLLERHPASSQAFIPMTARAYLVLVAPPGELDPDATVGFLAAPDQGIVYTPGTWHHPLVALYAEADFVCLVWEDGTAGDCELHRVEGPEFSIPAAP